MEQLHKRFQDEQVRNLMKRYVNHEIKRRHIQEMLGIKKARFFALLERYKAHPNTFSIQYVRSEPTRQIDPHIEQNILKELAIDKKIIKNKHIPLKVYNYSYVKERLESKYHQQVSVPTIIDRAKKNGFYLKERIRKAHDREVLTRYIGELIQHDSSFHLWAPDSNEKWYLITSLDDYSRYILYAVLVKHELVWTHIFALERLLLTYGVPLSFYVDSHAIFRFVRGRDEFHYKHHLMTDDTDTQWKQVLKELSIKPIYALSPQAKGKIERPYRWLQDHLIRTCVRGNVTDIAHANRILQKEVYEYNHKRIHSTTGEIPLLRFQRAVKEKQTLFRELKVPPPFESLKDIFCLRADRTADQYRKVSLYGTSFKINDVSRGDHINLRIYPLNQRLFEVRFWADLRLRDIQTMKTRELKVSGFNF